MPLKRCTLNEKSGWKWGDAGKCYTYQSEESEKTAKKKALAQGIAMGDIKISSKAEIVNEEKRYIKAVVYESSLYKEKDTGKWIAVCNKSECNTPFYLDETSNCPKCGELGGDKDGEAMTADDVEKACWLYLEGIQNRLNSKVEALQKASTVIKEIVSGSNDINITEWIKSESENKYHIGIVHQIFDKSTGVVVENYCEHSDIELFGNTYTKSVWKIGQILNEDLFKMAKSGELVGYSFHGAGYIQPLTAKEQ